jgi:hypothetical protein
MERKFWGLTMKDVTRLAYQLAVTNGIKKQFCKRNEKAERKWLKIFLRRHPQISVRNPEDLSLSRARGFTLKSEGFHSQERGVSLLKQQLSFF